MTTDWFDAVKTELLAQNPFRGSEYFRRFSSGALAREQAWGHISQWYFLICWFPRMFSGIHSRCDQLEVRKDCARHLLVEDLGFFRGQIGGTPDHVELYQRIGDDMGYPRGAWGRSHSDPGDERDRRLLPTARVRDSVERIAVHHGLHRGGGGRGLADGRPGLDETLRLPTRLGRHELSRARGGRAGGSGRDRGSHSQVHPNGRRPAGCRGLDARGASPSDRIRDGTRTRVPRSHITCLAALVREAAFSPSLDARSETNRAIDAAMSASGQTRRLGHVGDM